MPARINHVYMPTLNGQLVGVPSSLLTTGVGMFTDLPLQLIGEEPVTITLRSLQPLLSPDVVLTLDLDGSSLNDTYPPDWVYGHGFLFFGATVDFNGFDGHVYTIDDASTQTHWDQLADLDGVPMDASLAGLAQFLTVYGDGAGSGEARFGAVVTGHAHAVGRGMSGGSRPYSIPIEPVRIVLPEPAQGHGVVRLGVPRIAGVARLTYQNRGVVISAAPALSGAAFMALSGVGAIRTAAAAMTGRGRVILRRAPQVTVKAPSIAAPRRVGTGRITASCHVTAAAQATAPVPIEPPRSPLQLALQDEAWLLSILDEVA